MYTGSAIAVILGFVSTSIALSQQDQLLTSISDELETKVEAYVVKSLLEEEFSQNITDLQWIFRQISVDSSITTPSDRERLAEIKRIRSNKGIRLSSSYQSNLGSSIFDDEGSFYNWRLGSGFQVNILKGGFVGNAHKVLQKELQHEARKKSESDQIRAHTLEGIKDYISYSFNMKKVAVIDSRLDILKSLLNVTEKMYYLRYIHWEEVLDIMAKKTETELLRKTYDTYIRSIQLDSTIASKPLTTTPIFTFDFDQLKAHGLDTLSRYQALDQQIRALNHQHHWTNEVSLSAHLRYNHYNGGTDFLYNRRDLTTAGMTLSLPIPFGSSANKEWKIAKQEKLNSLYQDENEKINNKILNIYYEHEFVHQQYINTFYEKERLANKIMRGLRKRDFESDDYSPKDVVNKLDQLLGLDLRLIDLQEEMYITALDLFNLIDGSDILDFIRVQDYNENASQYSYERIIYCDAEELKKYEANYLIEILEQNQISEIVVNGSADSESYLAYAALLDESIGRDLKIWFSIDLSPGKSKLSADLDDIVNMSLTPFIHFNLSTMSLEDLPRDLNATIADLAGSHRVSASLPFRQQSDMIANLIPLVDYITLVADDSKSWMSRYYIISSITQQHNDKLNLAIHPGDFNTKLQLDDFIDQVLLHFGMREVSISSLDDLIDLDRKTLNWHEKLRF